MKKALFLINKTSGKRFYLYSDIDALYGGWMLETGGSPYVLRMLENAGCDELIAEINAVISSPATKWEPLTEGDQEYIADHLKVWGNRQGGSAVNHYYICHHPEFGDDAYNLYYAPAGDSVPENWERITRKKALEYCSWVRYRLKHDPTFEYSSHCDLYIYPAPWLYPDTGVPPTFITKGYIAQLRGSSIEFEASLLLRGRQKMEQL